MNDIKNVCDECAPKPDPKYLNENPRSFIGKLIKKGFPYKRYNKEHLWVKVTGFKGMKTLTGIIVSDPLNTDRKKGDKVRVTLKEIEDVHSYTD